MALHRLGQPSAEYTPNPELEKRYGLAADDSETHAPPTG
jgi:hypothetical protein